MKVAITGENGFLGYHLTKYYTDKNFEVMKMGRNFLENLHLTKDCQFIIHAAGVNRAISDQIIYDENVNLASNLVAGLKQLNATPHIKFISSKHETGDSAYGKSKIKAKSILANYCEYSNSLFESYALPNLFGTHGKPNYNSFVNTFAYNVVRGIDCNYNHNQIQLCWVYDAIDVIDKNSSSYKLYNTTPSEIYFLLLGISKNTIDPTMSPLANKLEQILNYYKQ